MLHVLRVLHIQQNHLMTWLEGEEDESEKEQEEEASAQDGDEEEEEETEKEEDDEIAHGKFRPAKPGKLPSLARAMAMKGPGSFTLRLLQEVPASSTITSRANAAEKHWDYLLGPTLNSRTPFGGAHRLNW